MLLQGTGHSQVSPRSVQPRQSLLSMKCVEISVLGQIPGPPPWLLLALSLSYAFPRSLFCFMARVEKEK